VDTRTKAEAWLLLVTFIWGWSFPVMKLSFYYVPPTTFLLYRFGIAALILFMIFKDEINSNINAIMPGIIIGVSLSVGQELQAVGLLFTSSSHSGFITSLYIVFSPIIAYFMIKEEIKITNIISLIIATIGLYLLSGIGLEILSMNFGDFLTVFSALAFAFQIVLIQKYTAEGYDYKALTFWQVLISFLSYMLFAYYLGGYKAGYNVIVWIGILYTSIISTVLALIILLKYQKYTTVQRASVIYAGEPIFAYLASLIALREILPLTGYIGALLIIISILVTQLKR